MGILRRAHWAAHDHRANKRSAEQRAAAHPPPPRSTSGTVMGFVGRLLVALMLLGWVLDDVWSVAARDQLAGSITQGVCSARPQPHTCQPGVPASAIFGDFLAWVHGE